MILLLVASVHVPSSAQEIYRGGDYPLISADTSFRTNSASILFDRNLNTYNWIGRAAIDTTVQGVRIGILQQYASNVIMLEGGPGGSLPKLQSSQQNLSLLLRKAITEDVAPEIQWTSFVYSDNKGTGLNNVSSHSLLGGADFTPLPWFSLTPMAGYLWETQAGIADRGPGYSVGARVPGIVTDGYDITGTAQLREDFISPRRMDADFAHVSVQKSFSPYTRDSLDIGATRSLREFYSPADSNIETRTEQLFSFANKLEYDIDPMMPTTVFFSMNSHSWDKDLRNWNAFNPPAVEYDTHIDEFFLQTFAQIAYRPQNGSGGAWVRLSYSERTETHAAKQPSIFVQQNEDEHQKDNTERRTTLSGLADIPLSLSDRIMFSGAVGILRYDTPSELNVEDRDELLVALTLSTSHRISHALELGLVLDGTLSHLVYLLKERSANNNFNRVLRLSPRTIFRPVAWISSLNALEVLANYTVYDFEQELPSVKSYSYRQFGWLDSTSVDLTHRLGCDFFSYWRVYEQGQLQWSQFRERLESAATEQTYAFQIRVSPALGTLFAIGFRYFGQWRYSYTEGQRQLDSYLSNAGPTCAIVWDPGPHSRIQFQGWYERRKQPDGIKSPLASMTLNISVIL